MCALVIRGRVAPAELAELCERARAQPDSGALVCDVAAALADAGTIDALARQQLAARRNGHELRLLHASRGLLELLDLCGLNGVLPAMDRAAAEGRTGGTDARCPGTS
jgi:ABC-type transporter Mla MlaB component